MTHSTRTTRTLITLTCALLCGLSISAQAQGLKTNSGSFGSGWQVGGAGSDTGGGYGSSGSGGSGPGSPGSGPSSYGGYSSNSNGAGTSGSAAGSYGGYSGAYSGTSGLPASEPPTSTDTPYSAPRSAGGGLRTQ